MSDRGQERAKAFGTELKLWRIRAELLQTEVADRVGVHSTSVSQWERGHRADVPDRDLVEALDTALGANGAILRAAGYGADLGAPVTHVTDHPRFSAAAGGVLPIPEDLTPSDIAVLLAVANALASAHQTAVNQ